MIPNTIHYCWFGNKPISRDLKICMNTWKKVLPDYTWKRWSEENFNIDTIPWTREAYDASAMAFVADYARLFALYHEGGIYLDTDVWFKKSFDPMLQYGMFTATEYHPEMIEEDELANTRINPDGTNHYPGVRVPGIGILSAVLGAEKGHPFLKTAMEFYEKRHFIQPDGSWYTAEIAPDVLAISAEKYGFKYNKDIQQHLNDRIVIYPTRIMGAAYTQITDDTVAVHLSKGSWRKRTYLRSILTQLNFYRKIFKSRL